MTFLLETPVRRWECARCNKTAVTRESQPHTQFHSCSGLGGFTAPMVQAGSGDRVRLLEREDYIGRERGVQMANDRPIFAAVTDHADGSTDCAVYPGTAYSRGDA